MKLKVVLRGVISLAAQLLASVLLFLVVRAFVVEMFKIPTPSMEGTLLVGDFLVVEKLSYGAEIPFTGRRLPAISDPKRGEVIVFRFPEDPEVNFVKRIVGVPGDTLLMDESVLYLNGVAHQEPYVQNTLPDYDPSAESFGWQRKHLVGTLHASGVYMPSRNNWGPLVVPEDNYFVLGDNRDNSLDSRYWGFVPDSLVRGRPLMVYFSYSLDSTKRFNWLRSARWSRLGTIIR